MVKNKNKSKKTVKRQNKTNRGGGRQLSNRSNPTFGAVSTINTAPIAIGNSMRGATAQVVQSSLGMTRLVGRDYAFTAAGTGSNVTNWQLVGGFPITPACFISSVLRNYTQMYNKFKFNKLRCHYITSSPTTTNGDIMFSNLKNRIDPCWNFTGAAFLPSVLSDPLTIIGPQWTNHTVELNPRGPTRTLDPAANNDVDYQAQGELLLFSKTSSTDSPGYIVIDYDITFYELSVNPRQSILPNPDFIWQPVIFTVPATTITIGNNISFGMAAASTSTTDMGAVDLTASAYFKAGNIYKVYVNATATRQAAWTFTSGTTPTLANLVEETALSNTIALPLTDGFTVYAVIETNSNISWFATLTSAYAVAPRLQYGVSFVSVAPTPYSAGVWISAFASYVGTTNALALQNS